VFTTTATHTTKAHNEHYSTFTTDPRQRFQDNYPAEQDKEAVAVLEATSDGILKVIIMFCSVENLINRLFF
jgi:hypothetical protein